MNFLNLGLGELLGLAGAISAGVVALYLLDRSKRRQVVATLRFWRSADVRTELKHRRRIQQPWSLVLQLISLALLLTAIAGPQIGVFDGLGNDHVLVLDTSAWMGAVTGQGTLFDQAKASALAYVRALPRRDRVMVVRADALATPATAFESNRAIIEAAILESQPSASALRLGQAVEFAQRVRKMQSERAGEITFVGAARVTPEDATLAAVPANLRYIGVDAPQENVGLRRLGLRRSPAAPDRWEIFAAVRNYGRRTQVVDLSVQYALSPAGNRRMTLRPGSEEQATFVYPEKAAGYVEARLNTRDAVPQDDRALVEVPRQAALKMIVYSNEPQTLRPLFAANPLVEAEFRAPNAFDPAAQADIVVLDRFAPPSPPRSHVIWIEPPASGSPVPIRTTVSRAALERWSPDTSLGAGLYTRDVTLESAAVFLPAPGDITVAAVAAGPVVVARDGAVKQMLIGFHPGRASMRYELATPLLIANTLRWMAPAAYRRVELEAGTVGSVSLPVGNDVQAAAVQILDEMDQALPFTIQDGVLRFFSGKPGTVRVRMGDRETVYSLTLPDLAEASWKAPQNLAMGIPEASPAGAGAADLWPWLALAGAIGLLADWLWFGRSRALRLRAAKAAAPLRQWRKAS
jgi:hypothetical protein